MTCHDQTLTDEALKAEFLEGMSRVAATVNVVTTDGPAGKAGVTVSAMSSVSADGPAPRLLVCVHRDGGACGPILDNGAFCVNLLRADQSRISDVFAGREDIAGEDRFGCAEWIAAPSGAPRLEGALTAFDCRLTHAELVGTHYVIFGSVGAAFVARGAPLIYCNRVYGAPKPLRMSA